ncbi:MAG: hypothetical protein WBM02_12270 [bacterium]
MEDRWLSVDEIAANHGIERIWFTNGYLKTPLSANPLSAVEIDL